MLPLRSLLRRTVRVQQQFMSAARHQFNSVTPEDDGDGGCELLTTIDVAETRSPPPKGLAAMRVNEGGNINRADLLGTITELKLLDRLSKPDQQWATMFVRTRIPILTKAHLPDSDTEDDGVAAGATANYRSCTYYNRVHVFDRRLLPMVHRLRPGDRVFVTGFISYYKPNLSSTTPVEIARVRKIGAVVAERLVLLGSLGVDDREQLQQVQLNLDKEEEDCVVEE